jgi:hypothetical protein
MASRATVSLDPDVYGRLVSWAGARQAELGRPVSVSEAISMLLEVVAP